MVVYEYTLHINGVQRKSRTMYLRPGIVEQMVKDIDIFGKHLDSFEIHVKKVK